MASMTIELSEYVIDAIANAVVKKMQQPCDYYDTYNKTCRRSEVPKEPCEDAISRQAVLGGIEELKKSPWASDKLIAEALEVVADLCVKQEPSVTPQPKMGHWFIDERPESDREIICSNCEQPILKYHKMDFDYRPKYCPNCGAKMESEDKEC